MSYIRKAVTADRYSVLRSARDIAHALYFCFFYGPTESKLESRANTLPNIPVGS